MEAAFTRLYPRNQRTQRLQMPLLGFSMGQAPAPAEQEPSSMNMSLDEVIASRRTFDQQAGTTKARREAKINHRRGLRNSDKPTSEEIDRAIRRENVKTLEKELEKTQKGPKKRQRQKTREIQQAITVAKERAGMPPGLNRPPTKKAVKAAIKAMEEKGFTIPDGMQMVISFSPVPGATVQQPATPKKQTPKKQTPKKQPEKEKQTDNKQKKNTRGRRSK